MIREGTIITKQRLSYISFSWKRKKIIIIKFDNSSFSSP